MITTTDITVDADRFNFWTGNVEDAQGDLVLHTVGSDYTGSWTGFESREEALTQAAAEHANRSHPDDVVYIVRVSAGVDGYTWQPVEDQFFVGVGRPDAFTA